MHVPAHWGPVITLLTLFFSAQADASYFVVNHPSKGSQWANGATNYASWTLGASKEVNAFDVELARLSTDGLLFVARNVPTTASTLPITLTDVPPADDYFLLFLNSTHGVMYAMSQRFAILPAGQEPSNSTALSKAAKSANLATVSVSGSPNPTSSFAYTFAPSSRASPQSRVSAWTTALLAGAVTLCAWL